MNAAVLRAIVFHLTNTVKSYNIDVIKNNTPKEQSVMNRVIEVLRTVLPVAVMLFIGILCRKKRLISREGINALKSIVVNIYDRFWNGYG